VTSDPDAVRLGSAASPDVAAAHRRILLVPLGATEQHGPHLPLDTDTVIASAWAEAVAGRVDGTIVAPALAYGSSGEHQSFVGTLSIGHDALRSVLIELGRSARSSFDRIVFVSGHAGNTEPLHAAVERLRYEGQRADGVVPRLAGADAHAGDTETSLMLFLRPDAVRMDRVEAGALEPLGELMDRMRIGGVAAVAANGVLGDPTTATRERGAAVFEALVTGLVTSLAADCDC
jgi:creatinine amidohydrolase